MSLWGWMLALAAHVAVTALWGGIVGGVLCLVYRSYHEKKQQIERRSAG